MDRPSLPRQKTARRIDSTRILFTYSYSVPVDLNTIVNRLTDWSRLSYSCSSIARIEISDISEMSAVKRIHLIQLHVTRSAFRTAYCQESALKMLEHDCCITWEKGLIHGDLNRKNIIADGTRFKIVDIEPVIDATGSLPMMATYPYIASQDQKSGKLSTASDLLALYSFASWLRGKSRTPYEAALFAQRRPHLIEDYKASLLR